MPPIDTKGLIGDSNSIIASVIWGAVGSGFAIYGWKQKETITLFGGIAIVAGSYFFANSAAVMSLFSIAAIAVIIWLKKYY
ncbi:MAG TPA: hypothetical protein VN761_07125 [Candidatus Polarisedimenticolia bacterium]|nr:hypothetical protein [Candidatus Polarisedimenticolia bacterium]